MHCYESVYEIQNAELFPMLFEQYEVSKWGIIKN